MFSYIKNQCYISNSFVVLEVLVLSTKFSLTKLPFSEKQTVTSLYPTWNKPLPIRPSTQSHHPSAEAQNSYHGYGRDIVFWDQCRKRRCYVPRQKLTSCSIKDQIHESMTGHGAAEACYMRVQQRPSRVDTFQHCGPYNPGLGMTHEILSWVGPHLISTCQHADVLLVQRLHDMSTEYAHYQQMVLHI